MTTQRVDAWHEAGHVVVGLSVGLTLDFVTIGGAFIKDGGMYAGKWARALTCWKAGRLTLDDDLLVCLAGPFVEDRMFPDFDSCWAGDERVIIYLCWSALVAFKKTPEVAREEMWMRIRGGKPGVPTEVVEYCNQKQDETLKRLSLLFEDGRLWSYVRLVAEALLKQERLTGTEVYSVLHRKVGRNEPCLCGSGLKSKKCHCDKGNLRFELSPDSALADLLRPR